MEIISIFEVTENGKGKEKQMNFREEIQGCGQDAIKWLRKQYPRYTKFVLKGFEVVTENEKTGEEIIKKKKVNLYTHNYIR